jgi:pilus assembly protein CpaE
VTAAEIPFVWNPLVVSPDGTLARAIQTACRELGMGEIAVAAEYPQLGEIASVVARRHTNLVFIDLTSNQEHALLLVAEASATVPVVALNRVKDADLILRCVRRGACEFLSDISAASVRAVFDRLGRDRSSQAHRRDGIVYMVLPAKPGCGASTIAVHLALELRSGGQRKVLLVDADALTASVGFILKLKSEYHLEHVLRDWSRMEDDLWSRLVVAYSGMDVLLAPEDPATRLEIGAALADEMLAWWKQRYDAVVLDLPDVRSASDSGLLAHADRTLLITTNELAALHAARRAIEFLALPADRNRRHLIVNRYAPALGLKKEDLKAALPAELFAVLSNDHAAVQEALLDGKPVAPGSHFRASVEALCRQLQGQPSAHKPGGSWLGFLHHRK